MITVKNLNFAYHQEPVLENLTFSVQDGEFCGLIGPNGSGKSTLLKCLCGILKPQNGEIFIGQNNLLSLKSKEIAQRIAVVPQESHFAFNFTCYEIVLFGRSPYLKGLQSERREDHEIALEALRLTGALKLADHSINEISGGERQKVVIARALAQNPKILLLDEPTSHLDIDHQLEILELLKRLNQQKNLTVIFVSHDLNLASEYCQRLILLDGGQIKAVGSPEEIIRSDLIYEVYGVSAVIQKNPLSGTPHLWVAPKSRSII
ncbi:MAG: ABC transporter ATP-binding protein [Candidatus Edwardsbacteria bacterium]